MYSCNCLLDSMHASLRWLKLQTKTAVHQMSNYIYITHAVLTMAALKQYCCYTCTSCAYTHSIGDLEVIPYQDSWRRLWHYIYYYIVSHNQTINTFIRGGKKVPKIKVVWLCKTSHTQWMSMLLLYSTAQKLSDTDSTFNEGTNSLLNEQIGGGRMVCHMLSHHNQCHKAHNGWYSRMVTPSYFLYWFCIYMKPK